MNDHVTAAPKTAAAKHGYRMLRSVKYLLFGIATIGAFFTGYTYLPTLLIEKPEAIVTGSVTYDPTACSAEYPLLVTIKNGTDDVLTSISFNISGRREGYSTTLYGTGFSHYSTDKIVPSGNVEDSCWPIPQVYHGRYGQEHKLKDLVWEIDSIRPWFNIKFQDS